MAIKMAKQNWFETLWEALESENLLDKWENYNISYGETARQTVDGNYHIVIFRNTDGRYERSVHYKL